MFVSKILLHSKDFKYEDNNIRNKTKYNDYFISLSILCSVSDVSIVTSTFYARRCNAVNNFIVVALVKNSPDLAISFCIISLSSNGFVALDVCTR